MFKRAFSNIYEKLQKFVGKFNLDDLIFLIVEAIYFVKSEIGKSRKAKSAGKLNKDRIYKSIKEDPIFRFAIPVISNTFLFLATKNISFLIADLIFTMIFLSFLSIKVAESSKIDLSERRNRKIISAVVRKILKKYWKQILVQKGTEFSKKRFLRKNKASITFDILSSSSEIMDIITKELIDEFRHDMQSK